MIGPELYKMNTLKVLDLYFAKLLKLLCDYRPH